MTMVINHNGKKMVKDLLMDHIGLERSIENQVLGKNTEIFFYEKTNIKEKYQEQISHFWLKNIVLGHRISSTMLYYQYYVSVPPLQIYIVHLWCLQISTVNLVLCSTMWSYRLLQSTRKVIGSKK